MLDFITNKPARVLFRQLIILVLSFLLSKYAINYLGLNPNAFKSIYSLASILTSASMTAFGFVLVLLGILASMTDKTIIKNMEESGHFKVLLFRCAITSVGFLVSFIFSLMLLGARDSSEMLNIVFLVTFSLSWSLLMTINIGRWIYLIFSNY